MENFWVSMIIQDTETSKPWLCAMSSSCASLEKAMEIIIEGRKQYRVLSAWIDTFDENDKKSTVFHECYINAIGNIES